jgi:outer membrane protein OmpA-like peptidoglycan-associated protein
MTTTKQTLVSSLLALGLLTSHASAQSAGASLQFGTSGASADASADTESDGIGTEAGTAEFGLYWGLFMPDAQHELVAEKTAFHEIERVTPEFGLRAGYYPWRMLGLELEAGLLPSQTRDTNDSLNIFALRAHAMLLAPTTTIVPFLAVGGGILGVASEPSVLGSDIDGELHIGIGAKAYATEDLAVRLDIRDNITNGTNGAKRDQLAMHWEALIGLSVVVGRDEPAPAPAPPPPDSDGDGIDDTKDKCKDVAGVAPDGCPPPDSDGDGIPDSDDACAKEAGVKNDDFTKHGCPPPPADGDGDGVPDASDKCPTVAGDAADGCIADTDADGLRDTEDKCKAEPETKNGFEDADGCPDELPEEVKKFTGAIEGIVFEASKATIMKGSFKTLDAAVKVLTDYVALRMEISGHSDTSGNADKNTQLSKERAEAVKQYFVEKGVAAERLESRGAGSAEPVADNKTAEGRAKNRRIEISLLRGE